MILLDVDSHTQLMTEMFCQLLSCHLLVKGHAQY